MAWQISDSAQARIEMLSPLFRGTGDPACGFGQFRPTRVADKKKVTTQENDRLTRSAFLQGVSRYMQSLESYVADFETVARDQ